MITKVIVNHYERNYFNDYDELRHDEMAYITEGVIERAVDKLVRRYRTKGLTDCLFTENHDHTGWRLVYDYEQDSDTTSKKRLLLRHYTNTVQNSWDIEKVVTPRQAKDKILGREH